MLNILREICIKKIYSHKKNGEMYPWKLNGDCPLQINENELPAKYLQCRRN